MYLGLNILTIEHLSPQKLNTVFVLLLSRKFVQVLNSIDIKLFFLDFILLFQHNAVRLLKKFPEQHLVYSILW